MTIQIAGTAILLLSAVSYSYILIKNERKKLAQTEDFCRLILYIKNNIDAFMTPIGEILLSFSDYGDSFADFMELAKTHGLSHASAHCTLAIEKESLRILEEFSAKIGCGYKDEELRLCQYSYNQMTELLKKERDEIGKKTKMYKTLPIMSAVSILLMLS